jgi:hypothetical protein
MREEAEMVVLCISPLPPPSPLPSNLQVVEMCWRQQLYDAMIHVYNYGLLDYRTPLLELLLQLRRSLKESKVTGELVGVASGCGQLSVCLMYL